MVLASVSPNPNEVVTRRSVPPMVAMYTRNRDNAQGIDVGALAEEKID